MKSSERGILAGLAVLMLGAVVFILWKASQEQEGDANSDGSTISTRRLPDAQPLRTEQTPGGVVIQVLEEGRGEPVQKGEAMDIAFVGYIAASGARFQQNVKQGLVLENGGVIEGWIEGLQGIRRNERRRLLVPSALGYGEMRHGRIMPNSDLVFDVQWAALHTEDISEGSGALAEPGSMVKVFYKGTLENGKPFDSNIGGDAIEFPLTKGSLIDGWVLGVPGMRVGGKRRLWVPWHLAYGSRARPVSPQKAKLGFVGIPPFSNLIFEIELVGVKAPK